VFAFLTEKYPFPDESKRVPSLPHLVVVPLTLMGQWEKEIKTFIQPHKVDIFLYHANKQARTQFWGSEGPYQKSKHEPHQKWIIATENVRHILLQFDVSDITVL
jgi:TATA-binding protein-associated factor